MYNFLQSLFFCFFFFTIPIFLFSRVSNYRIITSFTLYKMESLVSLSFIHIHKFDIYISQYEWLSFSLQMSPWRSLPRTFRVGSILTHMASPCFDVYCTFTSRFPVSSRVLIISIILHCLSSPLQFKVHEDKSFLHLINLCISHA